MQLPRVIIAAVFFVIGALIAIPALTSSSSSSRADSTPVSSSTLTPTAGATARATARTSPGATAQVSAKATVTVAPSPSGTPTHPTTRPAHPGSVSPKITITPKVPAVVPLKATVAAVRCPGPEITVKVTNNGIVTEDYTIEQDGQIALADRVGPKATRSNPLTLTKGQTTRIVVTWRNKPIRSVTRTADCTSKSPVPAREKPAKSLPHTGPDDAAMYAKISTGVAAMITGVIIFWWGGIWPRRREHMYGDGGSTKNSAKKDSA